MADGFFGVNQGQGPPAVGPWGRLVRGIQSGGRGVQQGDARRAAIGEGIRRFEAIGTDEATRLANLMRENPRGASVYANTFGGWENLYNQTKSGALQQRSAQMQARATGDTSEEYFKSLIDQGFSRPEAAQMAQEVAGLRKTQAETAEKLRPAEKEGAWKNIINPATGKMEHRWIERDEIAAATGQIGMQPGDSAQLTNKSAGLLQSQIFTVDDAIARIKNMRETYDPSALKYLPRLGDKVIRELWKVGLLGDVSEERAMKMGNRTVFRASVFDNVNRTIQEITGAQMNAEEAKRIIPTQPNMEMTDTEFEMMMDSVEAKLTSYRDRRTYLLNAGIISEEYDFDVELKAERKSVMSIERFEELKEARGDQIEQRLKGELPDASPQEIMMKVHEELDREMSIGVRW